MGLCIVFGDKGFVDYATLKNKFDSVHNTNKLIVEENKKLREEINLLQHDIKYIEKIAQRELGMVKKNSLIYRFYD